MPKPKPKARYTLEVLPFALKNDGLKITFFLGPGLFSNFQGAYSGLF